MIHAPARRIVGLAADYGPEHEAGMAAQWQRFLPLITKIEARVGGETFGVLYPPDQAGRARYLTGVEVHADCPLPSDLSADEIPAQTYAAFRHDGPVSTIGETWAMISGAWLPKAQAEGRLIAAPRIERYGADFDPATGRGDIEIWIPIRA